jgi:hypothetical protein
VRRDDWPSAKGDSPAQDATETGALRYLARSRSRAEFVSAYHPFVDESTMLFPADGELTVGDERDLAISLPTGETVLRARCGAMEFVARHGDEPGLGAIRASVLEVAQQSQEVYQDLLEAARRAVKPIEGGPPPLRGLHQLMSAIHASEASDREELPMDCNPDEPLSAEKFEVPTAENRPNALLLAMGDAVEQAAADAEVTATNPTTQVMGAPALIPTRPRLPAPTRGRLIRSMQLTPPPATLPGVGQPPDDLTLVAPRAAVEPAADPSRLRSLTARVSAVEEPTRAAPLTSSALASLSVRALLEIKAATQPHPVAPVAAAEPERAAPVATPSLARKLLPGLLLCLVGFGAGFLVRGALPGRAPHAQPAAVRVAPPAPRPAPTVVPPPAPTPPPAPAAATAPAPAAAQAVIPAPAPVTAEVIPVQASAVVPAEPTTVESAPLAGPPVEIVDPAAAKLAPRQPAPAPAVRPARKPAKR